MFTQISVTQWVDLDTITAIDQIGDKLFICAGTTDFIQVKKNREAVLALLPESALKDPAEPEEKAVALPSDIDPDMEAARDAAQSEEEVDTDA